MPKAISKVDLIEVGYSPYKASEIIRRTKLHLVNQGFDFYKNKRLGRVPVNAIEQVIGFNPFISDKG